MRNDLLPSADRPGLVLVVGGDASDGQEALAGRLDAPSFSITLAHSAPEALALCGTNLFEAILSGISTSDPGALELCRDLRNTPNARTPFMFLTPGPMGDQWVMDALAAGALDCFPSQGPAPMLLAKLKVMVRISRQQAILPADGREQTLLELVGGAAHEISQPLAGAHLLLDLMERQKGHPSPEQMSRLREFLNQTAAILDQIRGLRVYVTKPYPAGGLILDLEKSRRASGAHEGHQPAKPEGSE